MTYSLPNPLLPFLLLLALCLLLVVGLSLVAVRRANRTRRTWRLAAGLVAVAGLWLLAYPPSNLLRSSTSEVLLLTDGYSADTLRHLLRELGPGTRYWRYAAPTSSPDTLTLSNLAALRQRMPGLRRVHVLGQGLPSADLPGLGPVEVVAHVSAPKACFRMANWARSTEVGHSWTVEGYLENPAGKGPVWVRLRAAGAVRDSVQLPTGHGSFRLAFAPKAANRTVYQLEAGAAGRGGLRVPSEPLPLEVVPARPLRVLLLAGTPSFEFRFLKEYLGRKGHSVAVRIGLSRGLTQTEFLNQPAAEVGRLTPTLLSRTDIVLTDAASLAALSGAETTALQGALRNGQSGLVMLAEPTAALPRSLPARSDFRIEPQPTVAAQDPQKLQWPSASTTALAIVPATFRSSPALRTLVTTQRRQPVAAARRIGLGQVVVTTIAETFPWVLQGQTVAYAAYWSHLLSAAAPPQAAGASIMPQAPWPRPDAPVAIQTTNLPDGPITIRAVGGNNTTVALRQDARVAEWAQGTYWPSTDGWHQASQGKTTSWFYVFSKQHWQGPETQLRQQAAAAWMAQPRPASGTRIMAATSQPWSRWWGFGLFLLGAGLLWLEEKL